MPRSFKHLGSKNELIAICALWDMGYEVFRNQSQHGIADLIAWHLETGVMRKFDVKASNPYKNKSGTQIEYIPKQNADQIRHGVEILCVTKQGRVIIQN